MENFTRWDDYLVAEHELIERGMAALRQCLEAIELSAELDTIKLSRALDFLLQFGDRIHNSKEEQFLFPLLNAKGVPVEGGPIGVMLMEHESERKLLGRMLAMLPELSELPFAERIQFKEEGMDYLRVRAEHIWKENDILYPMGRRVLAEDDNQALLGKFADINRGFYGEGAFPKFQAMAAELETGGRGGKLIENLSYRQLDAIMEAMPFEVTFVDAKNSVAYFNRLDKAKVFPRTRSVVGRQVEKCHPEKSVITVRKIVHDFQHKTRDKAEFWIDFKGDKVLIRYFPVYGDDGEYLGVLEVTQEIGAIQRLTGQRRLLDD